MRMRPRLAYLRKAPKRERTLLVMIVFVTVLVMTMPAMIVPVMVEMSVPVFMRVLVPVFMLLGTVMQPLARPRPARVLAEHQRLDGDRHGVGRHADTAEVDVIEIP